MFVQRVDAQTNEVIYHTSVRIPAVRMYSIIA